MAESEVIDEKEEVFASCVRMKEELSEKEELKGKIEEILKEFKATVSQEIYARRKTRAEHFFGHIKRNLKVDAFMLRGRDGVQAETSLLARCYNIVRMIRLCGSVAGLKG